MSDQILEIVSEHMSTDFDTIFPDETCLLGLVVDLEDDLNISITDEELMDIYNVGQLVALVEDKLHDDYLR